MTFLESVGGAPCGYDFYEVVRRVECENPAKPRVGESQRPVDDAIRLGQAPSLAFAPTALAGVEPARGDAPPRLLVNFFGLLGPNGPLPLHLTEYARDRLRNSGDPTLARFLNLFHHRLLSFFYRIWANAQPTVDYDRPGQDRFSLFVGALFGLGMPTFRDRDAMPDLAKLHHAGRLAVETRNEEGLRAMLGDFFGAPFRVEPFLGHWLVIPENSRWRLGESETTGRLGHNVSLGGRVWECQQKFRVIAGPLAYHDYQRLLPGGEALIRLMAVVRNYVGDELAWDLRLVLEGDQAPPLRLDGRGRLGWTAWLPAAHRRPELDDLVLNPLAEAEFEQPAPFASPPDGGR